LTPTTANAEKEQWGSFTGAAAAVVLCYVRPLIQLLRFSVRSDLYSYIVLIPFISIYLVWLKRSECPFASKSNRPFAGALFVAGIVTLAIYWTISLTGREIANEDYLALITLSFLLFFWGVCGWCLGWQTCRTFAFPLGFLLLMVPLPTTFADSVQLFLQNGSAAVAYAFFKVSGTPVFFHELTFQLPGITLEVAPECSGIHSSMALFITSLLAGYLFLSSKWKRTALAVAVIPIALLRNGFRVFTIGELCVRIGPEMINSYIHRHGGPLFFVLFLLPFLLFLRFLAKSERPEPATPK
jgi:exosortase C (VPDSG-CTERM-specific)